MSKFVIVVILLLTACSQRTQTNSIRLPANSKSVTINLANGLDTLSLYLPDRYDTTFTWIHYSDCGKPCEKRKYRYQPKTLPAFPETGYRYNALKDSVDQFTIVHNPYITVEDFDNPDNKSFITSFHDHKKWNIIHDPSMIKISSDTIEKIGDRYFSIIVINAYDTSTSEFSKKLLSSTTVKSGTIDFNFELLTKKDDNLAKGFIDNAKSYLRTIRFGTHGKQAAHD